MDLQEAPCSQTEGAEKSSNGTEYPDDERELYCKIMEMTFVSEAAAFFFYNRYAKDHGFGIRKHQVKRFDDGEIRLRRFVCFKQGRRAKNKLTKEGRKYRNRPESRCSCKARMVVMFDGKTSLWIVQSFNDKHNHVLARPDEVPFLWSHRKINDSQRAEILSLSNMGVRKQNNSIVFHTDDGGGQPGRCHRKRMNQKALIKMREHPFHSRLSRRGVSNLGKGTTEKSAPQRRSPVGLCQPYLTEGTRQIGRAHV